MTIFSFIIGFVAALVVTELLFRLWHRRTYGRDYFVAIKFPWDRGHVVSHPFLTFAYRKHGIIDINQTIPYALWPDRFYSFRQPLRLNNMGHFGDDFRIEKPDGVLRVACLGSSGTANSIADDERDWSYPELLREKLLTDPGIARKYHDVEVLNCGIGGWTTLDVLVNYTLNITHLKPDAIIFYQGLNDLPLHLMDDYALDYTHGRRNLGEALHVIKRGYWLPKIRWWHSYEFAKDRLVGTGNVRNEVLARVETSIPDYSRPYRPLVAEEMALRNLLILARAHGSHIIISSYVFYLHNDSQRNRKLREGVTLQNQLYRRLAGEFGAPFVDLDALMPRDREHFVDAVHFTPQGMRFMAEHLGNALLRDIHLATTEAES
ncbi:MAG: SGNH/GDSL hydrolase family protein [Ferrovibrio sp.]|uniref:SGNH/GDSL hydrolase family protein n=1 Tax=Ferrovibrio sp. TaxID=1917215 RepID=UPI00391A82E4